MEFERVFYKNNFAAGVTIFSKAMQPQKYGMLLTVESIMQDTDLFRVQVST